MHSIKQNIFSMSPFLSVTLTLINHIFTWRCRRVIPFVVLIYTNNLQWNTIHMIMEKKLHPCKRWDMIIHSCHNISGGLVKPPLKLWRVALPACKLLCSYLQNQYQRVKICYAKSDFLSIGKGAPQGSILGPLLFNIFINDIFFINTDVTIYNYADDNCISYAHNDIGIIKMFRNLMLQNVGLIWE